MDNFGNFLNKRTYYMSLTITIPASYSPGAGSSTTGSESISCFPEPLSSPRNEFRPISPSPFTNDLMYFDRYIIHLFKSALGEDRQAVNSLLLHPIFKYRVFDVLRKNQEKCPKRISVLQHLAHYHINKLEKKEVTELIKAVGMSKYVISTVCFAHQKIQSLYTDLFHYPRSYSKKKILAGETNPSLKGWHDDAVTGPRRKASEQNIVTPPPSQDPFSEEELLDLALESDETLRPCITACIKKRFHPLT